MVPLNADLFSGGGAAGGAAGGGAAGWAAAGGAAAGGAAGDGGAGRGGAAPGAPPGVFIMSIVPLNFGAAAPFRLKPHLVQVVAASGFWVPQFGQNTPHLRRVLTKTIASMREAPEDYTSKPIVLKRKMNKSVRKVVFV